MVFMLVVIQGKNGKLALPTLRSWGPIIIPIRGWRINNKL